MRISIISFLDDPYGFTLDAGRGCTAFGWLSKQIGEEATVYLFMTLVYHQIALIRGGYASTTIDVGNEWARSPNINHIGVWSEFPHGRDFWRDLDSYFPASTPFSDSFKERLLNRIYLPAPPWANDVFNDVPFR